MVSNSRAREKNVQVPVSGVELAIESARERKNIQVPVSGVERARESE